ncbi:MAG: hypothetical protein AB9M53_06595 [Leptothrix sp. (in: b-proteobacteria)]
MKYSTVALLFASALAFAPFATVASTTTEYPSTCRYTDSNKKIRYSGSCQVNFGLAGASPKALMQYILIIQNNYEITVIIYSNDLATVNGIPAKKLPSPKGGFRFLTGEDEEFTFGTPPPGSM